ncbi:MAG TPA: type II toxin-antitoxin system VapC family toxin [Ktedonobacterales bacterium]|nr:type II toxin-antitoxin system VapC family toxin [Ktedonobacterales bacterium]
MGRFFFDTNVLVKLFVYDETSYWAIGVEASKAPRHQIIVAEIARVELPSALYKLERITPTIQAGQTDLALKRFQRYLDADHDYRRSRFTVMHLNTALFATASALLLRYRTGRPKALRSLDALQLASALVARQTLPESSHGDLRFVSADKQLRGCAQQEGFVVVDPNAPPGANFNT